ncbi:MAG: alkaline phosphatase family protein [Planctomycetes bacterium]|nr:alkaline phosphatase family protein [Planctomycetota bacterium]
MFDDSAPRSSAPRAAASAVCFVLAVAIALSAPSLTDPLLPGLVFVVLLPWAMAFLVASALGRMPAFREPRVVAIATSIAVALPWLLVAGAPLSRHPWIFWLGLLLAAILPLWILRERGSAWVAVAASVLLIALPESNPKYGSGSGLRPLVVVGMDSANWRFIEEMTAANPEDLPALQELRRRGAWAPLESQTPTASARIWTILGTGVNDAQNGIKNFGNRRSDLRAGRVWDAVVDPNDGGPAGTAGVVAWLINTPPPQAGEQLNLKFNTPGWVTGIREARPRPANPAKVLESVGEDSTNRPGYAELFSAMCSAMAVADAKHAWMHISTAFELMFGKLFGGFGKEDLIWRMKIMRDRINADVFFELSRRYGPDFTAFVMYGTDQIGHFYWKYHEAKYGDADLFPSVRPVEIRRMGEALRDSYRACDLVLSRLLEKVDLGEITLMLISDHGMQSLPESRDDKLLKLRGGALLYAAGGGEDGAGEEMIARFTTSNVDKALYISAKAEGELGRRHLNELRDVLESSRNLDVGQALFTLSFPDNTAQASLRVDFLEENRNTLDMDHQLQVGEMVGDASDLFEIETRSGRHHLDGFFLLAGHGIAEGKWLERVSIYDVAPTMLHVLGKPVPSDLPGRVVIEAFTDEHQAAYPVRLVPGGLTDPIRARSASEVEAELERQKLIEEGYITADDPVAGDGE